MKESGDILLPERGNNTKAIIGSPADGEVIPTKEIPDPMLSRRNDGIPLNGNIYDPCKGIDEMAAEASHAFSIHADSSIDMLVHAGIDAISFGDRGFECLAEQSDAVNADDPVTRVDLDVMAKAGLSPIVAAAIMRLWRAFCTLLTCPLATRQPPNPGQERKRCDSPCSIRHNHGIILRRSRIMSTR